MRFIEYLTLMRRLIDEMVKIVEKEINETEDDRLKDAYSDYLQDIREMAGTLGKVAGKMSVDGIIDPKEATLLTKIERK